MKLPNLLPGQGWFVLLFPAFLAALTVGVPKAKAQVVPTVSIEREDVYTYSPLVEGGKPCFYIKASVAPTSDLTVNLAYEKNSQRLLEPGERNRRTAFIKRGRKQANQFCLRTLDDAIDQNSDRYLRVSIQPGTGYGVGSPSTAKVLVMDNDDAPRDPVVWIRPIKHTVTEGESARFSVSRSGGTTSPLTVDLNVGEKDGYDFVTAGHEGDKSLVIPAGSRSAVYEVPTVDDTVDQGRSRREFGAVVVSVRDGSGYDPGGHPDPARVLVRDDDVVVVGFGAAAYSIVEGGGSWRSP